MATAGFICEAPASKSHFFPARTVLAVFFQLGKVTTDLPDGKHMRSLHYFNTECGIIVEKLQKGGMRYIILNFFSQVTARTGSATSPRRRTTMMRLYARETS